MGEVVGRGPRIKFAARRTGDLQLATEPRPLSQLSALMQRLEECGLVPVLDDGLVGGNAAIAASSCAPLQRHAKAGSIVVSRSGKDPGAPLCLRDRVLLTGFDPQAWAADYQSANEAARPTSDAPLHAAALGPGATERYGWAAAPCVAVHGHALAAGAQLERARQAGLPVSDEETLFSTPEDLAALEQLFRWARQCTEGRDISSLPLLGQATCFLRLPALPLCRRSYQYPQHRCFIRRGHGFTVLAETVREASRYFEQHLLPLL